MRQKQFDDKFKGKFDCKISTISCLDQVLGHLDGFLAWGVGLDFFLVGFAEIFPFLPDFLVLPVSATVPAITSPGSHLLPASFLQNTGSVTSAKIPEGERITFNIFCDHEIALLGRFFSQGAIHK